MQPGKRSITRGGAAAIAVAVATAAVLSEAVRVMFPLLYDLREDHGAVFAVPVAAAVFVVSPALTAALRRLLGPRAAYGFTVAALAGGRLAMRFLDPIPLWLASATLALGLIALVLQLHAARARGRGAALALAILTGLSLDAAVHGAFLTWDPAWQRGAGVMGDAALGVAIGWATILVIAAIISLARGSAPTDEDAEPEFDAVRPLILLGPFLLLELQFLQNAAFAASGAGVELPIGVAIVLGGDLLGIVAAWWFVRPNRATPGPRFLAALVVIGGTAALALLDGTAVEAALPITQAAASVLITLALAGASREYRTAWRTPLPVAFGMIFFVGLAFAYQIHIDVPLPVPRAVWIVAGAALLALAALRRPEEAPRGPALLLLIPLVGLAAVPAALRSTAPALETATAAAPTLRLLDWNLHSAVNGDGQVDLEGVAALIESQAPDVVALQEVARGWPITGEVDEAEWLSRRLEMPFVWAPSADDQFGNVVLSRFPIRESEARDLPYGDGPQHRSALRVVLEVTESVSITLIDTHLQNADTPATLEAQIGTVLDLWAEEPLTAIAGDFNMQPTEDSVNLLAEAGLVSAQDADGDPSASTAREPLFPGDRVDWIWGTPDLTLSDFEIGSSDVSDHLPLVVTISAS